MSGFGGEHLEAWQGGAARVPGQQPEADCKVVLVKILSLIIKGVRGASADGLGAASEGYQHQASG